MTVSGLLLTMLIYQCRRRTNDSERRTTTMTTKSAVWLLHGQRGVPEGSSLELPVHYVRYWSSNQALDLPFWLFRLAPDIWIHHLDGQVHCLTLWST